VALWSQQLVPKVYIKFGAPYFQIPGPKQLYFQNSTFLKEVNYAHTANINIDNNSRYLSRSNFIVALFTSKNSKDAFWRL